MRISIILLFLASVHFSSCKKFLEEKTQSEMTPETTEDYSQLLFGISYPRSTTVLMPGVHLMSDDVQFYANQYNNYDEEAQHVDNPLIHGNSISMILPGKLILSVPTMIHGQYCTNILPDVISPSPPLESRQAQPAKKNQLLGEAYALRAFLYWHLVNLYGKPFNDSASSPDKNPGVPLLLSADLRNEHPVRSTVAEVYTQIRKDIEQAITYFNIEKKKSTLYRFNYPAAHLFASRIYLYTEEWDKVIEHATASIGAQPMIIDLNDWPAGYYYDESMYKAIHAQPNVETLFLYGGKNETSTGSDIMSGFSEDLASKFEEKDLRNIIYYTKLPDFLGMFTPLKYGTQKRDLKINSVENFTSLRTSEAYLNRAEAYAQLYATTNNTAHAQHAIDDLNFFRQRRFSPADFQPLTIMPPADLLQFCRDERRRIL